MSNATRTSQQAIADAIKSGAVQAFADNKPIQFNYNNNGWKLFDKKSPAFASEEMFWRPAPTPRLRPWKPEEVPVGALIRSKKYSTEHRWMIVGWNVATLFTSNTALGPVDFDDCLSDFEHSLDGGKTWHPCGVMEGGE
jgi:hypothetical protein